MRERRRSGQALAEWAVVLPAVLLVTLGVAQFSLIVIGKTLVNHAAFAATRARLVGEDPLLAAQILCSPAGGTKAPASALPIRLPGWGNLPRSELAIPKTQVLGIDEDPDSVTVRIQHDFELWLPVVDDVFKSHEEQDIKFIRLTEKCTLPRNWSQVSDLGLP